MLTLPAPITSRTNAKVKALRASLSGEARGPGDLLGLEGWTLVREAHSAGMSFETIYLRAGSEAMVGAHWREQLRTNAWAVLSAEVFDSAVSTRTPQGIAATWMIREPEARWHSRHPGLMLEDIQDPGNLGTLIRSAAAFGMGDVLLTPESANPWNPKVVRAAAGTMFRVRVRRMALAEAARELRAGGVRLFAAVAGFLSGPEYGYPAIAARHGVLTGRLENDEAPETYRYPEHPLPVHVGEGDKYPASLCYDTDFLEPCAILIGNEGAGLSEEARRLADEQVLVPCNVESLNAAVAGSVLMYEAMRQGVLRQWARKQGLRT